MKFICDKNELSEALTNVSKAVSDKASINSLENIKFELSGNSLCLTGYDLELGIRTSLSVTTADTGAFLGSARLFCEMVRKMPDGQISVTLDENMMLTIQGGLTSYNMNALSADDYPELPGKESAEPISVPQSVLKSMIVQTKFAASLLDIKPILKGELFEIGDGQIVLAAIDGYRLAVRYEPIGCQENVKFVVPAKNLDEISKLLSDDDDCVCNMFLAKNHIIFEIGSYLVSSRLLEGEFHPYKSAIPVAHNTEVIVDRAPLINALERCMLLISEKNPSPVRCIFDNNELKIKCRTSSVGKVHDEIDVKMTGSPIEIGFKCRYFIDPLKVISDEKVKLQMGGNLQPMKIVPVEGDKFIYLVLPVRLPKE